MAGTMLESVAHSLCFRPQLYGVFLHLEMDCARFIGSALKYLQLAANINFLDCKATLDYSYLSYASLKHPSLYSPVFRTGQRSFCKRDPVLRHVIHTAIRIRPTNNRTAPCLCLIASGYPTSALLSRTVTSAMTRPPDAV